MQAHRPTLARHPLALATYVLVAALAACGGSDDDSPAPAPEPAAPTATITSTVIDGYLSGVKVCLDTNENGACDANEPSGISGANGAVTFNAPEDQVGRYPLVAEVGLDAQDADGHAITAPFTLKAPADANGVITPLTTLVTAQMAATGASSSEAADLIKTQLGLSQSPMVDFIAQEDTQAAQLARLVTITAQELVKGTEGATDESGNAVPATTINAVISSTLLNQLTTIATIAQDNDAQTDADLQELAKVIASDTGLNSSNVADAAKTLTPDAAPETTAVASTSLRWLSFDSTSDYFVHTMSSTAEQNTPDADGKRYFTEVQKTVSGGDEVQWKRTFVGWLGDKWSECPTSHVHETTRNEATGETESLYCGVTKSRFKQTAEDLSGKKIRDTVAQIRNSGVVEASGRAYSKWGPSPESIDPDATWPAGSALLHRTVTDIAGGDYFTGEARIPPNLTDTTWENWSRVTLDQFIEYNKGDFDPSVQTSNVHGNIASSVITRRDYRKKDGSWGYKRYFVGFNNSTQEARFYECEGDTQAAVQPRTLPGSCKTIHTTTYSITPLMEGGRSRVLRFASEPVQLNPRISYTLIERVPQGASTPRAYKGESSKAATGKQLRLNTEATNALLSTLGITKDYTAQ